jgi:RNA-directed DNA polymerase
MNEAKRRIGNLATGACFGFLGVEFLRLRSRTCKWRAYEPPLLKKRTVLLRKLKAVYRGDQSQPIERVIYLITPIVWGWVRDFAVGDASRCFGFIKDWVEKKVRRHLMLARNLRGFGWKRWSRRWLYDELGLFRHYRVHRRQ